MRPVVPSQEGSGDGGEIYVLELGRLRRQVRMLADQLDQIEIDLRQLFADLLRQRYEE